MDLWGPLPGVSCRWLVCLECPSKSGKGFDTSPSAWHQTYANPFFYSCFSLTAALPRAKVVTQTTSSLHCVGSARRWTWEEWGSQLAATHSQIMHAHLYFPSARFQLSAHSRKNDLHSCSEICDRCWRNKNKRPRPVLEHWRSRPCRRRGSRCHDVNRDWMSWL